MKRLLVLSPILLAAALAAGCLPVAAETAASAPPPVPAAVDASGTYLGILVIRPAVSELEMVFDLVEDDGWWHGTMGLPSRGIEDYPLDFVTVEEDRVSFAYTYRAGGTSSFTGTLAGDGSAIEGTLVERGREMPFRLERRPDTAPPEPQAVHAIASTQALREAFNAHSDKTRVVLLLSPTCPPCRAAARVVQRYLMDGVAGDDLATLVVWEPVQQEDTLEAAVAAAQLVPDTRASHYWTEAPGLADPLGKPLGELPSPLWDVFLIYPAGVVWEATAPAPAHAMHNGAEVPWAEPFDAAKLTSEVRELLSGGR